MLPVVGAAAAGALVGAAGAAAVGAAADLATGAAGAAGVGGAGAWQPRTATSRMVQALRPTRCMDPPQLALRPIDAQSPELSSVLHGPGVWPPQVQLLAQVEGQFLRTLRFHDRLVRP